jgi:microcin C transport system permease protein
MAAYILRRLLLMIPTIFGILLISFIVIQFAPGGPIEQVIARLQGLDTDAVSRTGSSGDIGASQAGSGTDASLNSRYRGAQGLPPEFIAELEQQFGFDKPAHVRFFKMLWDFIRFDFGESFFKHESVLSLIADKLPVSISLGLWMTLLTYLISIPLGIRKAVKDGTTFDIWTSGIIIIGYAVPGFLFAIFLIILFAGGNSFPIGFTVNDQFYGFHLGCDCFPLRGLTSDNWESLSWPARIVDYFWHLALPLFAMGLGAFATSTLLTKNSFLDEIRKQYVMTARSKGLNERQVLYGHVFRNAMLLVISGFPGAFVSAFFTGSLLIEYIFSLDGLGLLSYESIFQRDYPVVFANLFIFSLIGLFVGLISDITYTLIDPRIDFESREV